jgi:hypothetical protein
MSLQPTPPAGEPTSRRERTSRSMPAVSRELASQPLPPSLASAMHRRGIALPDLDLQVTSARQEITAAQGSQQPDQGEPA